MKQLLLLFLLPAVCFGQGDQVIIDVPTDGIGHTEKAIVHLPDDYSKTTQKYPLLVFLQGTGESGTNPASIYTSSSAGGPAYFIAQNKFPSSFTNPVDKQSYKFIVVSPQSPGGWSTLAWQLEYVLTYLFKTYRADETRLYLTGISAGGEGVLEYTGKIMSTGQQVAATHKVAAQALMSAVVYTPYFNQFATQIVSDNVRLWSFGSPSDVNGVNTLQLATLTNAIKSNFALQTSYSGGHCCWGQFYDPNFKQNGLSIYEWMLQYTQGTPNSGQTQPTGGGPNIPGKIEGESYSAMSGVQTQSTSDAGGGQAVVGIDYRDWMDYKVNVASAGRYTVSFRFSTEHSGASFQVSSNGNVLATVSPGNTSGFNNWQTVTATVTLPAGNQTLRLTSASLTNWQINWMQFASAGTSSQARTDHVTEQSQWMTISDEGASTAGVTIFPNPVKESFTLQLNNTVKGSLQVQLVDVTGAVRQTSVFEKTGESAQLTINSARLAAGVYFVRIQSGSWFVVKKIAKL